VSLPFVKSHLTPYISQWDEIRFNNAQLAPVPEEGVSRLLSQEVSERRGAYLRPCSVVPDLTRLQTTMFAMALRSFSSMVRTILQLLFSDSKKRDRFHGT